MVVPNMRDLLVGVLAKTIGLLIAHSIVVNQAKFSELTLVREELVIEDKVVDVEATLGDQVSINLRLELEVLFVAV